MHHLAKLQLYMSKLSKLQSYKEAETERLIYTVGMGKQITGVH